MRHSKVRSLPLTTRSCSTSCCRAACAIDGIVVDLSAMNRVSIVSRDVLLSV